MTIDRRRLVSRHNPVFTAAHPVDVLTIGNGDIAMTVDASGLQTFPGFHELRPDPHRIPSDGMAGLPEPKPRRFDRDDFQIPLRTQSNWGWYSSRTCRKYALENAETSYPTSRGDVPYPDRMGLLRAGDPIPEDFEPGAWLSYNPRRLHLGRLALDSVCETLALEHPEQLEDVHTELDLWSGTVRASYRLAGAPVEVLAVADPIAHRFAARIMSPLLADGLAVSWIFDPQPDDLADFEAPLAESVTWSRTESGRGGARRRVESSEYVVDVATTGEITSRRGGLCLTASTPGSVLDVVVTLAPVVDEEWMSSRGEQVSFAQVREASAAWWCRYWQSGAVVSFDGSIDERAGELERRAVLSQYLTAVNCSGSVPPAETGLTYNTWTGKFHLEMHWWHSAHFPMWGRGEMLERSLGWYHGALPVARDTARYQGYRGARWPKQTDVSARESPSMIGVFLVWQQPHIIYLLELLYVEGRPVGFLEEQYPLVEATADFMVDFVQERDGEFMLPPPLIPAQESYLVNRATNANPTFELAYWSWALQVANQWRTRLGLDIREDWARVSDGMTHPTLMPDGTYAALATPPFLLRKDHPSMLMALGWLPETAMIDPNVMRATLDGVMRDWDWQTTWGWDYPVIAMTSARLGELDRALDALLFASPKNVFLPNGHNPQMPGFLTLYLPTNGGMLAALAHIVAAIARGERAPAGWAIEAEGFPASALYSTRSSISRSVSR